MKKIIIGVIAVIIIGFLIFSNFGVQIGDIRVGQQLDLQTPQKFNIENSNFYRNFYDNESLVILNIWATWCAPCIKEMPDLNQIKDEFKDSPVKFISLSIDKDSVKMVRFIDSNKFEFKDITLNNLEYRTAITNLLEGRELNKHNLTYSIPKTYLIKNKSILKRINGQINKDELIGEIRQSM